MKIKNGDTVWLKPGKVVEVRDYSHSLGKLVSIEITHNGSVDKVTTFDTFIDRVETTLYKIGDRVRIIDAWDGQIFEVLAIDNDYFWLKTVNNNI